MCVGTIRPLEQIRRTYFYPCSCMKHIHCLLHFRGNFPRGLVFSWTICISLYRSFSPLWLVFACASGYVYSTSQEICLWFVLFCCCCFVIGQFYPYYSGLFHRHYVSTGKAILKNIGESITWIQYELIIRSQQNSAQSHVHIRKICCVSQQVRIDNTFVLYW